jgi:hypothetical protein
VTTVICRLAALIGVTRGEVLVALGSVVGGLLGVLGSAAAVYLMLGGQRRDERKRIIKAILREVVEFSRVVMGHLETCENIHSGKAVIPATLLPTIMQMPKPVVYPAIADRLGRLQDPQRVVTFFTRMSEVEAMAEVIGAQRDRAIPFLTGADVVKIATAWIDICQIGRLVIAEERSAPDLESQTRAIILERIDETLARARTTFTETGESAVDSNTRSV